jgi:hypothetical protein
MKRGGVPLAARVDRLESRSLLSFPATDVPGWENEQLSTTVVQPDGKTLAFGQLSRLTSDGSYDYGEFVARYCVDQVTLDTTFGTGGIAVRQTKNDDSPGGEEQGVAFAFVRPNRSILVVPNNSGIWQLTGNGTLDAGFGVGGVASFALGEVSSQSSTGSFHRSRVLFGPRLEANGTLTGVLSEMTTESDFSFVTGAYRVETQRHTADRVSVARDGRSTHRVSFPRLHTVETWRYATDLPPERTLTGVEFALFDADRTPEGGWMLSGSRSVWSRGFGFRVRATLFKYNAALNLDSRFGGTGIVTYFNATSDGYSRAVNSNISGAGQTVDITRGTITGLETTRRYRVLSWGGLVIV